MWILSFKILFEADWNSYFGMEFFINNYTSIHYKIYEFTKTNFQKFDKFSKNPRKNFPMSFKNPKFNIFTSEICRMKMYKIHFNFVVLSLASFISRFSVFQSENPLIFLNCKYEHIERIVRKWRIFFFLRKTHHSSLYQLIWNSNQHFYKTKEWGVWWRNFDFQFYSR